jgi:hypothetical protein
MLSVGDVIRACMDEDPGETESACVQIDSDGMVTTICFGLDSVINAIS